MRISPAKPLGAALGIALLATAACGSSTDKEGGSEPSASAGNPSAAPLYSELPQEIKDKGEIVFAGDSHPPYRTVESGGKVTGIDPEFQALLEKQLGVKLRIEITSGLPAILSGMLSGRYDAFNGPVRTTAERERDFDAIVWLTTRTSYVYPKDKASTFPNAEALCGFRVAGTTGSVTEKQLGSLNKWCAGKGKKANTFVGLADTNATILAMEADRADLVAVTETAAIDIVEKSSGKFAYLTQTDEQGAGVDQMAMFAPKKNKLGPVLFKATEAIFANGEYKTFMDKWKLTNVALDKPLYNPVTGG